MESIDRLVTFAFLRKDGNRCETNLNMDLSREEFKYIHDMICEPEMECIKLREQLQRKEEELQRKDSECERLKEELCRMANQLKPNVDFCLKEGYIVVSLKKLKMFLSGIKDTQLMGFIIFLIQKLLPKEADASTLKLIAETAPEEVRSDIFINAEGDVNVKGNYNHFQNNNNVNLQNS